LNRIINTISVVLYSGYHVLLGENRPGCDVNHPRYLLP